MTTIKINVNPDLLLPCNFDFFVPPSVVYWTEKTQSKLIREFPKSLEDLLNEFPAKFDRRLWCALRKFLQTEEKHRFINLLSPLAYILREKGLDKATDIYWERVHKSILEFEDRFKEQIHKGALYYFWAKPVLNNREIERGFLLIHQALQEDNKTHGINFPNTPAFKTATLNYEDNKQFLFDFVIKWRKYLDNKIKAYNSEFQKGLTIEDFHKKFLEKPHDIDCIFSFTYSIACLDMNDEIPQYLQENNFAGLNTLSILSRIVLVIDSSLYYKKPKKQKQEKKNFLYSSLVHDFILTTNKKLKSQMIDSYVKEIREYPDNNINDLITSLLDGDFEFKNTYAPSKIESLIYLSYVIRNFGAHNLKSLPIIWKRREEIIQSMFSVLFFTIETYY